jgi:cytochrome bd-type quinol oxidase subunit 2
MLAQSRIVNPAINSTIGSGSDPGAVTQMFIRNFITLAFAVGGLIFFFMLLRGGYSYITAGGDKDALDRAKKTISHALIGVALLFSIFAIITVVETLFGISLRNPSLPTL